MKIIQRYEINQSFAEALARLEAANAIERFRGSIEAYENSKGGQRFEVIDTGTPIKYIQGNFASPEGILADAMLARRGRLVKVMGKLAIPTAILRVSINNTLLQAYDLGATALVDYTETDNNSSGTPVKPM